MGFAVGYSSDGEPSGAETFHIWWSPLSPRQNAGTRMNQEERALGYKHVHV